MDDDEELWAAADFAASATINRQPAAERVQQPAPQKIQQPVPQRLDKRAPSTSSPASVPNKIVQPTPKALPQRSSGSSILVSPRQRGNPVLAAIKSTAWEYSDIAADYGLGLTTCALFLSLKYHRLHPEYIYTRIKNIQGKYNLRIILTLVDIPNHEDPLKELAKTSLVNNCTLICCWSAAEAARYLELYKSYEKANFKAIQGQQGSSYVEKLVDFVTVPRGVNKTDAVSLVGNFGSLKNAINADPEQIAVIGGWGEVKVKRWCTAVDEPFRSRKAARREAPSARGPVMESDETLAMFYQAVATQTAPQPNTPLRDVPQAAGKESGPATMAGALQPQRPPTAMQAVRSNPSQSASGSKAREPEQMSEGIAAALSKLKRQAGLE